MAMTAMIPTEIPMMKKTLTMATTEPFIATPSRAGGNESPSCRRG